jgi:hypothetical protein
MQAPIIVLRGGSSGIRSLGDTGESEKGSAQRIVLVLCSPPQPSTLFRPTQATVGGTRNSWLELDLVSWSEWEQGASSRVRGQRPRPLDDGTKLDRINGDRFVWLESRRVSTL